MAYTKVETIDVEKLAPMDNAERCQLILPPWAKTTLTIFYILGISIGFFLLQVLQTGCMHIRLTGVDNDYVEMMDASTVLIILLGWLGTMALALNLAKAATECNKSEGWVFGVSYTGGLLATEAVELVFFVVILLSRAIWNGLNV